MTDAEVDQSLFTVYQLIPYLQNDPWRLGVIPQGDPKQTQQCSLGIVGFRAPSVDNTSP